MEVFLPIFPCVLWLVDGQDELDKDTGEDVVTTDNQPELSTGSVAADRSDFVSPQDAVDTNHEQDDEATDDEHNDDDDEGIEDETASASASAAGGQHSTQSEAAGNNGRSSSSGFVFLFDYYSASPPPPPPRYYRGWGIVFNQFLCLFIYFLFVSLSARLRENGWIDLHEIFREGAEWPWIQFWVNSEKPRDAAMLISLSATRGWGLLCFASQLVMLWQFINFHLYLLNYRITCHVMFSVTAMD